MDQHSNILLKWKALTAVVLTMWCTVVPTHADVHEVEVDIVATLLEPEQDVNLFIPVIVLRGQSEFTPFRLHVAVGDTVALSVRNLLANTVEYSVGEHPIVLEANQETTVTVFAHEPTVILVRPTGENFADMYSGAVGSIGFIPTDAVRTVTWNLREFQSSQHTATSVDVPEKQEYSPDYFTINNLTKTQLEDDESSIVQGAVDDVLYIVVVNAGVAMHSLHFHGYHTQAIASSDNEYVGWSKDTWPLQSGEWQLLQLVPDKPGKYPVHDHNLIAITGGGKYPNGMFTVMEVQP